MDSVEVVTKKVHCPERMENLYGEKKMMSTTKEKRKTRSILLEALASCLG